MDEFTILLVDDTPDLRNAIASQLRFVGLTVIEAYDGPEALELLQENPIDLLVSDYQMPYMNGLEFIAAARKAGYKSPVLLCSGNYKAVAEALAAGIEAFSKSFEGMQNLVARCQEIRTAAQAPEL
jgi:CheY-like chemotaxis protein